MEIPLEHEANIRRIIDTLRCPRERPCHTCDFETRGCVRPIGSTGVLDCLEERGCRCSNGLHFGDGILCMCPLRKYLVDHGLA
jgi:hypothetical protein